MTFHLYDEVVALYLDNSTAMLIYVIKVLLYFFSLHDRLPHLDLADKHGITCIPAYRPTLVKWEVH